MHATQTAQTHPYTWLSTSSKNPSSVDPLQSPNAPPPPPTLSTPHSPPHQPSSSTDEGCADETSSKSSTPETPIIVKSEHRSATSMSYSMEELLRSDSMASRRQKRKQAAPTQNLHVANEDGDENTEEEDDANKKAWPQDDFIAELSRSTADALTRALSKRTKLDESGDLKGIIREALENSLESLSHRANEPPPRSGSDHPDEEEAVTQQLRFPACVPPPTSIMETIASAGFPSGFGQSFSMYYEAACRVLQAQGPSSPPCRSATQSSMSQHIPTNLKKPEMEMFPDNSRHLVNLDQPEHQTEALSLVVGPKSLSQVSDSPQEQQLQPNPSPVGPLMSSCLPRKKRTKVTDTRLVPQRLLPPFSIEGVGGGPFAIPELPRPKIVSESGPPRLPQSSPPLSHLNFDNPLVSDIFKSISLQDINSLSPGAPMQRRRPLMLPTGFLLPPFDFMGPMPPHPHRHPHFQTHPPHPPQAPAQQMMPQPPHRQIPAGYCYDLSKNAIPEPSPIRRNRSIGGKRVTNTSTNAFGNSGRGFLSSGSASDDGGAGMNVSGDIDRGSGTTSTLTPVHLRKAKLMFFFTRYPNSSLLKAFFLDVKFNKNNTAQLVKWFSNFREFYYIQMEKFARVAISEGIRNPNDIIVTKNSELYRALALHYNRNHQIEIPEYFRLVVETTLREFFVALSTGKDTEQSWKKPIYKIIARMDQAVPEYFRDPNWMAQLADS